MLTTVHPPFDTRIFHKESKSLLKANHSVSLIAPSNKSGTDILEGININTVKKSNSKILHAITIIRVFMAGFKQDCDIYHCHEPTSLFVCALLKFIKKKKIVYDIHEHYPDLIAENSVFPNFARKFVYNLIYYGERFLSRYADYLITVDIVLEDKFKDVNPKIAIIHNYPRLELFQEYDHPYQNKKQDAFIYVGGLTKIRGILETIKSFELVLNEYPDAKLYFVGNFLHPEYEIEVMKYCNAHKLEGKVIFTGKVPHDEVAKYMKPASFAIGLLQPNPRYELAIPVKLFEYMAAGKVAIMSNFRYNAKLMDEIKCGIAVDPTNLEEITKAMTWLLGHPEEAEQMGKNGRRAVEEVYNWENMEKRLFKMYEDLS